MNKMIIEQMPPFLSGKELEEAIRILPEYDPNIMNSEAGKRLIALQDLYSIYIPNTMSKEIYSRMYLSLLRGLEKKITFSSIRQSYENFKAIHHQAYSSIMGGTDSFTILGESGIGKSSAVSRSMQLLSQKPVMEFQKPIQMKVIPCIVVQTPSDCSVKGLLLSILQKCDEVLDTDYYAQAMRTHATVDMLLGSVSTVCISIGMLILDETQNLVNSKNGKILVGILPQLINNSSVSIAMVGTPKTALYFEQEMMLARRTIGLSYKPMTYDHEFIGLCESVLRYQYVQKPCEINESIMQWLFQHSNGNASVLISLLHDAQEMAILSGYEKLDVPILTKAYEERLTMLHPFIQIQKVTAPRPKKKQEKIKTEQDSMTVEEQFFYKNRELFLQEEDQYHTEMQKQEIHFFEVLI